MSNIDNAALAQQRNRKLAIFGGMIAVIAITSILYYELHAKYFVSTDNAYADAEVATITPSVSGTVQSVEVKDTQAVKKGDVLVQIDPIDAKLALDEAEAQLNRAQRQVKGYVATDSSLKARIAVAQANFDRAKIDLDRRKALLDSGSVSAEEITTAQNAYDAAKADLDAALGTRNSNAALIEDASLNENPEVALARAHRDQARVDLERTTIRAPFDGVIARRSVQVGQRIVSGAPLMALVPVNEIYVDANFKEVQLKNVRVGQPVKLHADIYGSDVTYHGTVEGFSAGSGAAFSAIPAQNATGNWIKVVQRLPVRVKLDPKELQEHPLKVGLSMDAEIDTREQ